MLQKEKRKERKHRGQGDGEKGSFPEEERSGNLEVTVATVNIVAAVWWEQKPCHKKYRPEWVMKSGDGWAGQLDLQRKDKR